MVRKYPVVKDRPDTRDHLAAPPGIPLPSSVSLLPFLGPVKDQGELGACTGFAFAGLREFLYRKFAPYEKLKSDPSNAPVFSPMFQYYEERVLENDVNEDAGAQSRTGLQVLLHTGICLEKDDMYQPKEFTDAPLPEVVAQAANYKIGAYHRVPDLVTLKSVLASGYCASLAFTVYASFESDEVAKTGIVPFPDIATEANLGGHEVLAYGYDDNPTAGIMIRNSWGPEWGLRGDFLLPYEYFNLVDGVQDMWVAHLGKPW